MRRGQVISALCAHQEQIRALGVIRLSLFGSIARGEEQPHSDIDLLAALDESQRLSLLDVAGIEVHLSQMLGQSVELVEEGTLKPRVLKSVEAEAVRAF